MNMAAINSPEKGLALSNSIETGKLIVTQPAKLAALNELLVTLEAFPDRVSETLGEDRSAGLGGSGGQASGRGDDATTVSVRDKAIAALPVQAVMQQQLQRRVQQEVHELTKIAHAAARSNQPGSAHRLNRIYARIRRLNSLLAQIFESSYEVLRRLFIRVFIDNQPVL